LASINAVFNSGRREFDIQCLNPFEKMVIPHEGHDTIKRVPFTIQELRTISAACRKLDDDIRWIVGLQLATGARLAEIVGLRKEDILFDATSSIPFIFIRQHLKLGRSLKTPGSERMVPLFGISLWAAQQAVSQDNPSGWLFPRYAKDKDIRATHCSNTINKWFRDRFLRLATPSGTPCAISFATLAVLRP